MRNSRTDLYHVVPLCTGTYWYVPFCPILSRGHCTGFKFQVYTNLVENHITRRRSYLNSFSSHTGSGKMVHTGTYQYVPVQHGIRQYENFTVVCTGMYRYMPVRTFNKTSCFLTHPERVRRDKIKVVQLICMGYNVTKSNFKTTQV